MGRWEGIGEGRGPSNRSWVSCLPDSGRHETNFDLPARACGRDLVAKRATNKQAGAFLHPASPVLPPFGWRGKGVTEVVGGQNKVGRETRGGEGVAESCHGRLQVSPGLVFWALITGGQRN